MPGIVLTPSPERTYRSLKRELKPVTHCLSESVTHRSYREMIGGKSYLVSQYQIHGTNLGDLSKIKDIVNNGEKLCIIPLLKKIPSDSKRSRSSERSDPMVSPGLLISPPCLIASPNLLASLDPMVSSDLKFPGPLILPELLDGGGTDGSYEQTSSYLKDCVHKIIRGKRYFVPVDSKTHGSLLSMVCEFKHSSKQHILCSGTPLYDFYFKDQRPSVRTMIKVGIHWFIEFH
jgi:hypothetical protein